MPCDDRPVSYSKASAVATTRKAANRDIDTSTAPQPRHLASSDQRHSTTTASASGRARASRLVWSKWTCS